MWKVEPKVPAFIVGVEMEVDEVYGNVVRMFGGLEGLLGMWSRCGTRFPRCCKMCMLCLIYLFIFQLFFLFVCK